MRVVGFVPAAMRREVRGSERYDGDDREGEGEGGVLGSNVAQKYRHLLPKRSATMRNHERRSVEGARDHL